MNNQHTPDLDKIKSLLNKVNALAERGIDGEKDAARKKLKVLLEKYGIALKEIQANKRIKREFSLKNKTDCLDIFQHCVYVCAPKVKVFVYTYSCKAFCSLTPEEFVAVSEKFRYYWKLYEKQKAQFLHAFLIKNNLSVSNEDNDNPTLSDVETKELMKLVSALEKGSFMPNNRMIETNKN